MSTIRRPVIFVTILAVSAATLLGVGVNRALVTGRAVAAGPDVGWTLFGNNTDNNRYSSLSQINSSNVGRLGIAWTKPEGPKLSVFETDPIVVGDTMYYTTNTDQVYAVNAATGQLKWRYTPAVNFYYAIAGGGGGVPTNRGVTVVNGKVYLLTFDDKLVALQASTGEKLWSSTVANAAAGFSETSPPTYWNNMLFVGSAESDAGLRGFVAAYNATTGRPIWRFFTVPARGHGWMPLRGQHGGGDVWMPPTIDTTTGKLYFGTGNPSPDMYNKDRPGCDPWVDATVALDARTGRLLWGRTQVCPDLWDYDSHQPTMLFYVHRNGQTVRAVGQGNKEGYYWVFNAATGATLSKSAAIVPQTCCPRPHPTLKGVKVCPTASGGIEFSPPAYSPLTQAAYEPALRTCAIFKLAPPADILAHKQGAIDFGGTLLPAGKNHGTMAAIDVNTGRFLWKDLMPQPMIGGALATAGNLVFSGADDGHFYAFDARTGKILWSPNLGLSFGAAPMTYLVNGVQYVAVAAGGADVSAGDLAPLGGTLVVFKLGGRPIHKLSAVVPPAGLSQKQINTLLQGTHPVNSWMFVDRARSHVVIRAVAAATNANNGFNFDGYTKGNATFVVPYGWTVDMLFSNKDSRIPHSLAIATNHAIHPPLATFGFLPPETPKPTVGTSHGITQAIDFPAIPAGQYYLVCLVPGHIQSGMWIGFTVSKSASVPSIQAH